ncbi:Oligosaccharide translocation protein rft1 [Coemansia interrupta]|uniref:Man(5)GlcNAc(2)-PP-dolichol translocation protein RFT1 n=1 Tax=Coemansia interrupta TaxID=1126814 RepID=A0A9W8LIW8_9FUNG|nr:Oligosaccharide translocation protein rft1 [Coemansia interrupta]
MSNEDRRLDIQEHATPKQQPISAFAGAQYLMGLQVFVRLATFSTNAIVVRLTGLTAFGVASVRFELLLSTILFLSREGVRNALLRVEGGDDKQKPSAREQRLINAALLPIGTGAVLAGALYAIYGGGGASSVPYYAESLAVYVLAAWIELLVEPLYVLSRARVLFQLQARGDAAAVSARCIVVALALLAGSKDSDGENKFRLLALALGQLGYAVALLISYAWLMRVQLGYPLLSCYKPRRVLVGSTSVYIDQNTRSLAVAFVGQSLVKHILTQGDSMVMTRFADDREMGVYALVSSYASIPARILFLPLEEAARMVFAQSDVPTALHMLTTLAKLQSLLGCISCVFGGLYAPVFLPLIGQSDPAIAHTLSAYFMYLPLLGLNGFLEAFAHTTGTRRQLGWVNAWMVGCSATYIMLSIMMLDSWNMGSLGMVLANMANMSLRICYCCWFAYKWLKAHKQPLPKPSSLAPHPAVILTSSVAAALSTVALSCFTVTTTTARLAVMLLGSVLGLAVLFSIWRFEQPFIRVAMELRSGKVSFDKKSK